MAENRGDNLTEYRGISWESRKVEAVISTILAHLRGIHSGAIRLNVPTLRISDMTHLRRKPGKVRAEERTLFNTPPQL
jgi:hypothetical protein